MCGYKFMDFLVSETPTSFVDVEFRGGVYQVQVSRSILKAWSSSSAFRLGARSLCEIQTKGADSMVWLWTLIKYPK